MSTAALVLGAWKGDEAHSVAEADAVAQLRQIVAENTKGVTTEAIDALAAADVVAAADIIKGLGSTAPVDVSSGVVAALVAAVKARLAEDVAALLTEASTLDDAAFALSDPAVFKTLRGLEAYTGGDDTTAVKAHLATAEEQLKVQPASNDALKSDLAAAREDHKAVTSAEAKAAPEIRSTAGAPYADLLNARAAAVARIETLHAVFKDVTENNRKVTKFVTQFAADWDAEIKKLQEQADDVDAQSKALLDQPPHLLPNDALSAAAVTDGLARLKEQRAAVEKAANNDKEAQAAFDDKLVEFNRERQRLLLWCRQEKTNLDGTTDVDAVQEFCATLLNHSPAMESNMAVLLEMAEPLLPSPVVQAALLETNEVWLNLHIAAYERLRRTLLEVHERAKLEDEVRAYSGYSTSAAEFLDALLKLLGGPTTAESQSLVSAVVDNARALRAELAANHSTLTAQLRDFALRMEGFRDNYANLRRAVFTRLTFLASTVPTLSASARRKEEYSQRMASLQRWVQAKSRGESWSEIKARIDKLRSMVRDEKTAMANEPPLSSAVTDPVS